MDRLCTRKVDFANTADCVPKTWNLMKQYYFKQLRDKADVAIIKAMLTKGDEKRDAFFAKK